MDTTTQSYTARFLPLAIICALFATTCLGIAACATEAPVSRYEGLPRRFESSFESVDDFADFHMESGERYESSQEQSDERVFHGDYSHKAWIIAARDSDNESSPAYLPHRAYPTIQFQKTADRAFRGPCLVSLYVWLDMVLEDRPEGQIDDWFSLATLSPDPSDNWNRTVLANLAPDGYLRLVHVPSQGRQEHIEQRVDILIDFDAEEGYATVWQNGEKLSHAKVEGGSGYLEQAHFGLYASAAIAEGVVYNDKLRILEDVNPGDVEELVNNNW